MKPLAVTSAIDRTNCMMNVVNVYWVTPSADGRYCYISWSGSDRISRISYRTGRIAGSVRVGDHPQRVRNGVIRREFLPLGYHRAPAPARTTGVTAWELPS